MPKRKRTDATAADLPAPAPIPAATPAPATAATKSATSSKLSRPSRRQSTKATVDPDVNEDVIDDPTALRASPDSDVNEKIVPNSAAKKIKTSPANGELKDVKPSSAKAKKPADTSDKRGDPEAEDEDDEPADPAEIKEASTRPPPVNSSYLPLPWKGRLGYACLCTYLRNAFPPIFQSRTTRIASILEHRHPLKDPSQPEHPTKNRPDKDKPADIRRGQEFVERLGVANCQDMIKMLLWNDKYNIKFLRLSSEAFPFASHAEYGYKLAPFAAGALAEVGKVVAKLGHRVTTHPGQFTQLGSPRKPVIDASIRDLEYHDEMLSLLKLPPQQDRDAVMVLHMGGVFGDKGETLNRFRENYARLSPSIKKRLVLENDDMSWSVHDLLPICQELNIPLVLDFHHHNIIFDSEKIREGTHDIQALFPVIKETWTRKGITQKMHYSEPTPSAITGKQRRKHNPRVATLPPCPNDMDLMIEAKDKEQAVFELMRTFKLPGYEKISDIIPHVRQDDNKPVRAVKKKKKPSKAVKNEDGDEVDEEAEEDVEPTVVPEEEIAMGGPLGRVYWPPTQEEWLRPEKRIVKKKDADEKKADLVTETKVKSATVKKEPVSVNGAMDAEDPVLSTEKKAAKKKAVYTPSAELKTEDAEEEVKPSRKRVRESVTVNGDSTPGGRRRSGRSARVSYQEVEA